MMMWIIGLLFAASLLSKADGLVVDEKNISGTESSPFLTDKQLAIQRWFAQLTFLQDPGDWSGWGDAVNDVDCDGNTCIRYEVAGLAYAAAVLAHKTPAYTQVVEGIQHSAILRMIDKVAWQYIELFDDFKEQSSYPDPVAYKNIMYSGHLAQMIALFESTTGNFTFSERGWEFSWGSDSEYPDPIFYNTSLLMQRIYDQTKAYDIGGVPCEPDSIFVICNNYPLNAFALNDATHGSSLAADSVPVWQATVEEKGVNQFPDLEKNDNNFFNLDYLIHPFGIWEPIGSVGSDVWALSWMRGWWPTAASDSMLQAAFSSIYHSSQWVTAEWGGPAVAEPGSEGGLHPQMHLHPGPGSAVFPFSDEITTSFYPMLEKQYLQQGDDSRMESVYRYFEANTGRYFDSDGDSVADSYQYNTGLADCGDGEDKLCETGDYSVWATANLLIAMTFPDSMPSFLNEMFHPEIPLYRKYIGTPKVISVEFPHVMVRSAAYESSKISGTAGVLRFSLSPGDNYPRLPHNVQIRGDFELVQSVYLNGEAYSDFIDGGSGTIVIKAPGWGLCDQSHFEFAVLFSQLKN